MAEDEDLVVVSDTDPEKAKKEYVYAEVSNLLWAGVIIGLGTCICVFGLMQQFVEEANTSSWVRDLVRKYWFDLKWWYWLGPLFCFLLMYLRARSVGRKNFLNKQ